MLNEVFNKDNTGQQSVETDATKIITGHLNEGFKLSFKIDKEGKLLYAVNGSNDYSEAVKASVAVQKDKVTKADDIKDIHDDTMREKHVVDVPAVVRNIVPLQHVY